MSERSRKRCLFRHRVVQLLDQLLNIDLAFSNGWLLERPLTPSRDPLSESRACNQESQSHQGQGKATHMISPSVETQSYTGLFVG